MSNARVFGRGWASSAVVCAGLVATLGLAAAPALAATTSGETSGVARAGASGVASAEAGSTAGSTASAGADSTVDSAAGAEAGSYTKEQVVYVKASQTGQTQGIYVVNAITAAQTGELTDEGRYTSVANLTDQQALSSKYGKVTFDASAGETFYYQGDLDETTALPWDVSVTYYLDGKQVEAGKLGGATGDLKMVLSIAPHTTDAGSKTDDEATARLASYSDAYLLQVSATFDADKVADLVCADATRATAGDDVQLTYMLFPGKSAEYVVEASVKDFSFDGWQIVGVPLAMSVDIDTADLGSMDDVDDLKDAVGQIDDGAGEVASGASDLKDGADQLVSGVGSVSDGVGQLSSGVGQLVTSGSTLTSSSADIASALTQLRDVALQLSDGLAGATDPGDGSVTAAQQAAQMLSAGLATLDTKYGEFDQGVNDYTSGVGQLASGATSLSDGVTQLYDGANTLADGASSLKDGASELHDGTSELRTQTADIDDKIADGVSDGVNDYLNPSYTPTDFVNGDTAHVTRMQFVIKTAEIAEPDEEEAATEENTAEQTFWDKLVALFK